MGAFITIITLIGGALALWAYFRAPEEYREIKKREKARTAEIDKALSEARTSRLGVVVVRFSWGYLKTYYVDGRKCESWVHGSPDSVNGWGCLIRIINSCGKTIKYCHFHIHAENSVGDLASVEVGYAKQDLNGIGPIANGDFGLWQFEHLMYSASLSKMVLDSIEVEYMDGTKEEFSGNNIVWR